MSFEDRMIYFKSYSEAQAAGNMLPPPWRSNYRIREYTLGFAVQIHASGPYIGTDYDPETHSCEWCDRPWGVA